jgi:threonine aldolase
MTAPYDFRSDTVTRPDAAMREAMAAADVGDDVMGEDPTVQRLQAMAAALLGKEDALYLPSGTMANQVAIHVHCRAGDELVCEERSHVYYYEGGAVARLSSTQVRPLPAADGFPTPEQVLAATRSSDPHYPRSRLLVVENSHNMAGGRVCGPERFVPLAAAARTGGMSVHVDGARLCNAAVAVGCTPGDLVAAADTVSLCLSKGLGAPVGSVLAGDAAFVAEARRARKAFGGGMRQAGVLAAAAIVALDGWQERLRADHHRARVLAEGLASIAGLRVDPTHVETNIVMVEVDGDAQRLLQELGQKGVLASMAHAGRVRFVTHRDVDDEGVAACLAAVSSASFS